MAAAGAPSGALSARGVAGEASPLRELLRRHGGQVPYYNVEGQQHYRVPFKEKGTLADVQDRAEWKREPRHRTRTELLETRRAARRPDLSYDVDGDGAVGPTDYFIGKTFGRERDHRLNTAERGQVVQALENGWLDKYSFGHEQAGAKRAGAVRQFRGKIFTADTAGELTEVYPPHWNAGKTPRHPTATDMRLERKTELRHGAEKLREQWDAVNPLSLPEPPVIQEFSVAEPPMAHISQRSEAFHSAARQDAGLDPAVSAVNPNREGQEIGLGHREAPDFATRTALLEARRARRQEDLMATRAHAAELHVPVQVARTMHHHEEYEARRANPQAMTLTKLTARRRQERIEHNMTNFTQIPPEPARFSDQEKPWWTMREGYCPEPPSSLLKEMRDVPEKVAAKVTEVEPPRPRAAPAAEQPAPAPEVLPPGGPLGMPDVGHGKAGGRRWSSEFVPPGLSAAKAPRLFDGRPAPTLSTDSAPLHSFSSFEAIRNNGALEDAERQRKAVLEDEGRAAAWSVYVKTGPHSPRPTVALEPPSPVGGLEQRVSIISEAHSRGSRSQVPRLPLGLATTRLAGPQGEDPPMTERLELLAARGTAGVEQETPKAGDGRSASAMAGRPRPGDGSPTAVRSAHDRIASAATSAPSPPPRQPRQPRQPQMAVRSSGFQWLDRSRAAQRLEEPSIPPSLRRTPQASLRNLGSESAASRTQSRAQAELHPS